MHLPVFPLLELSSDLLHNVADFLYASPKDLSSFAQVNRRLNKLLQERVFRQDIKHYRSTALLHAAEFGDYQLAQKVLSLGADPNTTYIHYNFTWGTVHIEKWDTGRAPLSLAAELGYPDIVRLLLTTNGTDVDARCFDNHPNAESFDAGRTALSFAAGAGHQDVMRMLLEAGADPESRSNALLRPLPRVQSARTPLVFAADGGHVEAVKLLLDLGCNIESKEEGEETPLFCAAQAGHADVVRYLLSRGANPRPSVRTAGDPLLTPLEVAIQHNREDVVDVLAAAEVVDAGRPNYDIEALFKAAAWTGNVRIFKSLIQMNGGDISETTLMESMSDAACYNHVDLATFFIKELGVDPDSDYGRGMNILSEAAVRGNDGIVQLLIQAGANPACTDMFGDTFLSKFILMTQLPEQEALEIIEPLLEMEGFDIRARNSVGATFLHQAARKGWPRLVKILIATGLLHPDDRNTGNNPITPLIEAANRGHEEVVRVLLKTQSINAFNTDWKGRTALQIVEENHPEKTALTEMLREYQRTNPCPRAWFTFR